MTESLNVAISGMHPAQERVMASQARFQVVSGGRRLGKTTLGVVRCAVTAFEGGRAWWVAPSLGNADEGWRKLTTIATLVPGSKVLLGERTVVFPSGGEVAVRTASEPYRLRGPGLDGLCMDEAAYIKPESWYEVMRPALADKRGWAMFISTPKGFNNWFYELFEEAKKQDDWEVFQISTYENPHIPKDEIEAAKRHLMPASFAQEFLGEFIAAGGNLFKADWFRYYNDLGYQYDIVGERSIPKADTWRFATVDLAASTKESADYTVISVWDVSRNNDLILVDMIRDRFEAPDITPELQKMYDKYRPGYIGVEKNGLGLPIVQYAIRAGLPVRPIDAGTRDIQARSMPLAARMEAGRVFFPREAKWLSDAERELLAFDPVTGGGHDDIVSAFAYAAIEIGGSRPIPGIGDLVQTEDPFGLMAEAESLGIITKTDHLVESEEFEDWELPGASEEW